MVLIIKKKIGDTFPLNVAVHLGLFKLYDCMYPIVPLGRVHTKHLPIFSFAFYFLFEKGCRQMLIRSLQYNIGKSTYTAFGIWRFWGMQRFSQNAACAR